MLRRTYQFGSFLNEFKTDIAICSYMSNCDISGKIGQSLDGYVFYKYLYNPLLLLRSSLENWSDLPQVSQLISITAKHNNDETLPNFVEGTSLSPYL